MPTKKAAKKTKNGRPRSVMTSEKEIEILTAIRLGLRPASAAAANGVRAQTLHSHRERHAEFAEKVEQAVAACERRAVIAVVEKFDTDLRAATWFLERRFPDVWGKRDAPPIETEHEPDPRFD